MVDAINQTKAVQHWLSQAKCLYIQNSVRQSGFLPPCSVVNAKMTFIDLLSSEVTMGYDLLVFCTSSEQHFLSLGSNKDIQLFNAILLESLLKLNSMQHVGVDYTYGVEDQHEFGSVFGLG